jgi:hypothetical protein
MKKMIMAAAITCIAVVTQAATVSWSITGLQNNNGEALSTGYAYTFVTKGSSATTIAAVTALLTADSVKDGATFAAALENAGYLSDLSGAVTGGKALFSKVDQETAGIAEKTSNTQLFAVIIDTETITDETNWYITSLSTGKKTAANSVTSDTSFSIADTGSHTAGNWQAVPEPTSGLLMLVGIAGLALRRRRA